jgi:predicted DNA-binding transcriptional regulator AlpA
MGQMSRQTIYTILNKGRRLPAPHKTLVRLEQEALEIDQRCISKTASVRADSGCLV